MKIFSKKIKHITLGLGALLMLGTGQAAFAHASILNAITSGATGFSRVGVNHADNHTSPPTPIVAQSVVFPTVNPALGRSDAVPVVDLGDYFSTSATGASAGTLPLTTLAGLPQLVQSRDIFTQQIEQRNALGKVIGWYSGKGSLQVNLNGEVPFRFGAVHFRSAPPSTNPNNITVNDLCVKSLAIGVAVADIANPTHQPGVALAVGGAPGSATANIGVNLWLDNTLPALVGTAFSPAVIENGAASVTLTINRDTTLNPYPANTCAGFGGTVPLTTVTVKPSADDIQALQYPGWGTVVPGNVYQ